MSYNKIIEELIAENEKQNEIIIDYREQNIELRNDIGKLKNQLFNAYLKQQQLQEEKNKLGKRLFNLFLKQD